MKLDSLRMKKLILPLVVFLFCGFANAQDNAPTQPNILILLADDMGSGDLGCYGGTARTPNLDTLAANGIKFNNSYSGAPNCSPARVSLLTGRMPARSGMYSYRPPEHAMHMASEELTMAEVLKTKGYQTAHIGKWHLSSLPQNPELNQPQPRDQGFDYSLGTENNAEPSHHNPINFIRNGVALGEVKGYASQLLADEFQLWFKTERKADQPFFVYLPFHEPHAKIVSPPELIAHYPDVDDKSANYFASVENLDKAVGRVLATLKANGLDKNTLVLFASDHGSYRMGSNRNFRGLKADVYDGGIRVPLIVSYPNAFPGKRELDDAVWFPDLLPTVSAMVGAKLPKDRAYDGMSLLPLLKGKKLKTRKQPMLWFFYRGSPEVAMRHGNYILTARSNDSTPRTHGLSDLDMPFIENFKAEFFELYNVVKDPSQKNDLAYKSPEKLGEMKARYLALFEATQKDSVVWEGLPAYGSARANHDKPAEFKRNQERFLDK